MQRANPFQHQAKDAVQAQERRDSPGRVTSRRCKLLEGCLRSSLRTVLSCRLHDLPPPLLAPPALPEAASVWRVPLHSREGSDLQGPVRRSTHSVLLSDNVYQAALEPVWGRLILSTAATCPHTDLHSTHRRRR